MATWLVKAGFQGAIADKFKSTNKIAVGWETLADFPTDGDWDDFRAQIKGRLPADYSAQKGGSAAGQLWAFAREMQVGDFVITPIKQSREVLIGRVTGPYRFEPGFDSHFQRTRTVEWFTPIPWDSVPAALRSCFSQWLTISRPSVDFTPIITRAQNHQTAPIQLNAAEEEELVAREAQNLSDRAEEVIREMLRDMSHTDFQHFVGGVFEATGFTVLYDSSGRGRDGGVDVILSKDRLGAGERIVVQVKHTGGPVGQPELQQLMGTLRPGEWGLIVSLSGINTNSERFWRENRDRLLKPIESTDLVRLIQEHYEHLGDEYKALLPLRRIYVPSKSAEAE